jgi:hypothetical protein
MFKSLDFSLDFTGFLIEGHNTGFYWFFGVVSLDFDT